MPEVRATSNASNMGRHKGGAYQDRDKPAQIRFSNISAAKGRPKYILHTVETAGIWSKSSPSVIIVLGWVGLGWAGHRYSLVLVSTSSEI